MGVVAAEFVKEYKDLAVYQRAYALSLEIHRATEDFPKHELYSLADQWKRTARGICANIAEGFAKQRFSKEEFQRFLSIAVGCCIEAMVWSDYAKDLGYISHDTHAHFFDELRSLEKMLFKLHITLKDSD